MQSDRPGKFAEAMKIARVQLYGFTGKYVAVDTDATDGAVVGLNLRWPDGSTVTEAQLRSVGGGQVSSAFPDTSDDVDEGQYNLYFTVKRAQDAVGGILTDTDTIDFTYDGTAHIIKADLKTLANAGGGALVKVARDDFGRVSGTSAATTDNLTEGVANLYFTGNRVNAALAPGDGIGFTLVAGVTTITVVGLPIYLISQDGDQLTDQAGNILVGNQTTGLPVDFSSITNTPTTLSGYGITDAQKLGDPVNFPPYTLTSVLAGTPPAASNQYKAIYVTGMTGGDEPCISDGTNWRRFSDRSIAS